MQRKKWLGALLACSLVLAACGDGNEENTDNNNDETGNGENNTGLNNNENDNNGELNNENDDEFNNEANNLGENDNNNENSAADNDAGEDSQAEEILAQSIEAMEGVSGYGMEMTIEQIMEFGGEEIPMDFSIVMEATQDPVMFHQVMTTPDPETGEVIEIEQYMDEEGTLYLYDEMSEEWLKMDAVMMGIEDLQDLEMSPQEQIEMLQGLTENIVVEEEDDHYALYIEGSGDELLEISKELAMLDPDPAMQEEMEQVMNMMDIETFDYVLYIDRDTYYQVEMDMTLEMEINEGEESMSIYQSSHGTFFDFDEIDEIEIPQDVIDNAVDIEEMEDQDL